MPDEPAFPYGHSKTPGVVCRTRHGCGTGISTRLYVATKLASALLQRQGILPLTTELTASALSYADALIEAAKEAPS